MSNQAPGWYAYTSSVGPLIHKLVSEVQHLICMHTSVQSTLTSWVDVHQVLLLPGPPKQVLDNHRDFLQRLLTDHCPGGSEHDEPVAHTKACAYTTDSHVQNKNVTHMSHLLTLRLPRRSCTVLDSQTTLRMIPLHTPVLHETTPFGAQETLHSNHHSTHGGACVEGDNS